MQEQPARSFRGVILSIAEGILVNVGVVEPGLIVIDAREGITDLPLACPQSFYLGALERNAGFKSFENMIVAPSFGIGQDLVHKRNQPEEGPSGCSQSFLKAESTSSFLTPLIPFFLVGAQFEPPPRHPACPIRACRPQSRAKRCRPRRDRQFQRSA